MKKTAYTPLYKTLADKLCDKIAAENLADGDFFCTIKDISTRYNVAVLTVRRAIEILQNNRIVESKSACGIFVKSTAALHTFRARRNFILIINDHMTGTTMASYWAMRLCAILQILSDAGFAVKIAHSSEITEKDLFSMKNMLSGIIMSASRAKKYPDFIRENTTLPIMMTRSSQINLNSNKLYFPRYDDKKLFDMGCNFFIKHNKKKIIIIDFDASGFPDKYIDKYKDKLLFIKQTPEEFPSVDVGRKIASALTVDADTALWVQDDFTALGIYHYFLSCSRNIIDENALLVTAGPTVGMTEQLKLPVIGFCPWESGSSIANYLLDIINKKNPQQPVIAPKANQNI